MRRWFLLAAFLPGMAFATPQDGVYVNPDGVLMNVTGATDSGFDFSLVAGGTDAGNICAEGDTACLQIDGHAEASPKGFTYIDPNDDHSRIFFAEVAEGVRVLSTIGDLGTGTANRMQKLGLRGVYAPMADQNDDQSTAAPGEDLPAVSDAADRYYFQSPTGNIVCLLALYDQGEVRCDMVALNRSYTNVPQDCTEDWGASFGVSAGFTRGSVLCVGDTVANPEAEVLDYGSEIQDWGITCTSAKSGMTCQNEGGHGFSLARKAQKVF